MYYTIVPDSRDSNKLIVTSLIDGHQSGFIKSSDYGRRSAVGEITEHNHRIVDYLVSTGQLAADVTEPTIIGEVWKNRRLHVQKLGKKFYTLQHSDIANYREARSLIDGHTFRYHSADVLKAIKEIERYNTELVNTLVDYGWLDVNQPHEIADVVRAYKLSIGGN
ncbi:hypothetical protein [Lacipirellula sp.]|uniref:hypothetical protein n=1 Tax=Lacipirellula sp. TaxID=2691419 RepID=UPI003D0DDB8E